jgi:citrate lyase gamma subunit
MDIKQIVAQWYQDGLRDAVNRGGAGEIEQAECAVEALPAQLEGAQGALDAEVDAWFGKHIRKPPISHDTLLYNLIHQMVQQLKVRLAAADVSAGTVAKTARRFLPPTH